VRAWPQHVEAQRFPIALENLPAYAPELDPVECIWRYLKHHAIPNYRATDFGELKHLAPRNLLSIKRCPKLVRAFWKQSGLL